MDALDLLAIELALLHFPNDPDVLTRGEPQASFFTIPVDERVWNMITGAERHGRLSPETDLWVATERADRKSEIRMQMFRN